MVDLSISEILPMPTEGTFDQLLQNWQWGYFCCADGLPSGGGQWLSQTLHNDRDVITGFGILVAKERTTVPNPLRIGIMTEPQRQHRDYPEIWTEVGTLDSSRLQSLWPAVYWVFVDLSENPIMNISANTEFNISCVTEQNGTGWLIVGDYAGTIPVMKTYDPVSNEWGELQQPPRAASCFTWTREKTCGEHNKLEDCRNADCEWWNEDCHDEEPTCEEIQGPYAETDCTYYNCNWCTDHCQTLPCDQTCGDFIDPSTCRNTEGCHYWNGMCRDTAPSGCGILDNESCSYYSGILGCNWCTDHCQSQPCDIDCDTFDNKDECEINDCNWCGDEETGYCQTDECVTKVCEDILTQSECTTPCHWYQKYFWAPPSCHTQEQNAIMDYLPFIILGVGGAMVAASFLTRPKPMYRPRHRKKPTYRRKPKPVYY
jgi:hypothetical protein